MDRRVGDPRLLEPGVRPPRWPEPRWLSQEPQGRDVSLPPVSDAALSPGQGEFSEAGQALEATSADEFKAHQALSGSEGGVP